MLEEARNLQDELVKLRQQFHSVPELSFEEVETRKIILDYLKSLGYKLRVDEFLPTAVVAELGGAPFVALRSDMDALSIHEQNASVYASRKPGLMHACGHDAHMACMLGAAKLIADMKDKLSKGVRIIFEPGSESNDRSGAKELIEAGALAGVEGIFGFHVDSTLAAGDISVVKDAGLHSSRVLIKADFVANGKSSDDAIHQTAQLICKLKEALPGSCGRTALKKLLFSGLECSSAEAGLQLSATLNAENAEDLSASLRLLKETCGSFIDGISVLLDEDTAGDTTLAKISGQALQSLAKEVCSSEKLKVTTRRAWSKDFEIYGEHVPAAFFYLGTSCGPRSHHSSTFEIDERVLYLATALLAKAVLAAALP